MKFNWKRALVLTLGLMLGFVLVFASFNYGVHIGVADDTANQAKRFEKGKATFCDLNEDARLVVCPMARQAIPVSGGAALVYVCDPDGNIGFVSLLGNIPPDTKTQIIWKLAEKSFGSGPYCKSSREEILWIKKGIWKTAALTL